MSKTGQLPVKDKCASADSEPVADSEAYERDGQSIDLPFGEEETILLPADDESDDGVTLTVQEQVRMDGKDQSAPTFDGCDGGTTVFEIAKGWKQTAR